MLLSKSCAVTKSIIGDLHVKKKHCGIYGLMNDLRKNFWIHGYYSAVKEVVKSCIRCKRLNARTKETNRKAYLVYIEQPFTIPLQCPMAMGKSIMLNGFEVSANIMKVNRQILHKHVNDLILLLKAEHLPEKLLQVDEPLIDNVEAPRESLFRAAKTQAMHRMAELAE